MLASTTITEFDSYLALANPTLSTVWFFPEGFSSPAAFTQLYLSAGPTATTYRPYTLNEAGSVELWNSAIEAHQSVGIQVPRTGAFGLVLVADEPLIAQRVIAFQTSGLTGASGIAAPPPNLMAQFDTTK